MKVLILLDELEDIVESGASVPFSTKSLVSADELLEIIQEIREKLPDEIKQAQYIKEQRKKILLEAQNEAEKILDDAENKIKEMVDSNEITKSAYSQAEKIIKKAQHNAKEIRVGAYEYADRILENLQNQAKEVLITLEDNRAELKTSRYHKNSTA